MIPHSICAAATVLLLATTPANADAIDGDWCHPDLGRMEIRGPEIVTPGGTRLSGDYDRHGFRHTVPAGEPGPGARVDMVLVDDDTLHRIVAPSPDAAIEVWRRCRAQVS
ncbi:MAG: hypothetical protein VW453_02615 [Rhodospirillaceae bacterium]